MILSRGRGYLFIHIPKTAGTALTLALEARAMQDDIILADTPKGRARAGRVRGTTAAGRLWKHSTLADLDGLVTPGERERLLTFTLVRNPWDRLVSFHAWARAQTFDHPLVRAARSSDLAAFLDDPVVGESFRAAPYGSYLRRPDGSEKPSLFLRLEHLDADAAPLEARLGFRLTPLARANVSDRPRDWRPLYSDRAAERLARICAEDIARFGYRFDP